MTRALPVLSSPARFPRRSDFTGGNAESCCPTARSDSAAYALHEVTPEPEPTRGVTRGRFAAAGFSG